MEDDFGISYDIIGAIQRELNKIQVASIVNEANFAILSPLFHNYIITMTREDHSIHEIYYPHYMSMS